MLRILQDNPTDEKMWGILEGYPFNPRAFDEGAAELFEQRASGSTARREAAVTPYRSEDG